MTLPHLIHIFLHFITRNMRCTFRWLHLISSLWILLEDKFSHHKSWSQLQFYNKESTTLKVTFPYRISSIRCGIFGFWPRELSFLIFLFLLCFVWHNCAFYYSKIENKHTCLKKYIQTEKAEEPLILTEREDTKTPYVMWCLFILLFSCLTP